MANKPEVSLAQRGAAIEVADAWLYVAAELWLDAKAAGKGTGKEDEELSSAVQNAKRARRNYDDTAKRLAKREKVEARNG